MTIAAGDRRRHSGRPTRPGRRSRQPSFGGTGRAETVLGGAGTVTGRRSAGRPGAPWSRAASPRAREASLLLARYTATGQLDPGFGRQRRSSSTQPRSGRQRARRGRRRQGQRLSRHAASAAPPPARRCASASSPKTGAAPASSTSTCPERLKAGSRPGDLDRDSGRRRRDLRRRLGRKGTLRGQAAAERQARSELRRPGLRAGAQVLRRRPDAPPSSTGAAGSSSRAGATTPPTAEGRRAKIVRVVQAAARRSAPIEPSAASGRC